MACPTCGGSQTTWKCTCEPMWKGYTPPSADVAAAPADERAAFGVSVDGTDAAREHLVRLVRNAVGNDTFTQYIHTELAGDFALVIANAGASSPNVTAAKAKILAALERLDRTGEGQ